MGIHQLIFFQQIIKSNCFDMNFYYLKKQKKNKFTFVCKSIQRSIIYNLNLIHKRVRRLFKSFVYFLFILTFIPFQIFKNIFCYFSVSFIFLIYSKNPSDRIT